MDPVLIAGAGPVGCTLALFLAQNDIPIILVEAEKTIPMDLRASTFHPPTLDMLARLGLVKDMLTVGLKVNDYQYRDRRSMKLRSSIYLFLQTKRNILTVCSASSIKWPE